MKWTVAVELRREFCARLLPKELLAPGDGAGHHIMDYQITLHCTAALRS